jgi:type VI secretion system secreted protein Hcp
MINKKIKTILALALLLTIGLLTASTFSAVSVDEDVVTPSRTPYAGFVKFSGINGEATEANHIGWSNIIGFEQGYGTPDDPSRGVSRRRSLAIVDDIEVTKQLDKASPKIAEGMLKGTVFSEVEIELVGSYGDAGTKTYYRIELKNALVTSYVIGSEDVEKEYPEDTFTINFEEVKVTYTEIDESGSSKGNIEYTYSVEKGE